MNIEQDMEMEGGERITTRTRTIEDEHYWRHLERQAAIQLHPVFVRAMLDDPRLIGQVGEDWPDGVAADTVKHARALVARLKGETE